MIKNLSNLQSRLNKRIFLKSEVRYYEKEVEAICGQIDLVREQIKDL